MLTVLYATSLISTYDVLTISLTMPKGSVYVPITPVLLRYPPLFVHQREVFLFKGLSGTLEESWRVYKGLLAMDWVVMRLWGVRES